MLAAAGSAGVLGTGAVGWLLAGPPSPATAVVPPACPSSPRLSGPGDVFELAGFQRGVAGQLVPMTLPQPRGPASVRLCGYHGGDRLVLDRQRVLDPIWTAWLAGKIDEPAGSPVTPPVRPAGCLSGDRPVVLVFRYTQGDPVAVEIPGGPCGLVATGARMETGRDDVVRLVAGLLHEGGS
jgi:hypothetical protein